MVLLSCKKVNQKIEGKERIASPVAAHSTFTLAVSLEPDRHQFKFLLFHLLALSFERSYLSSLRWGHLFLYRVVAKIKSDNVKKQLAQNRKQ